MPKKAITRRVSRLLESDDVNKQQKGAEIYKRRDEKIEEKKWKKANKKVKEFNKFMKPVMDQLSTEMGEALQESFNKSPAQMYGKPSSSLKSGSPLAKYGCTGKH